MSASLLIYSVSYGILKMFQLSAKLRFLLSVYFKSDIVKLF